jgi:S-formylglutathione hydrolase FrmB
MPDDAEHPDLLTGPSNVTQHPIDPRTRHVTIRSAALGINKSFYVSLPPSYGNASERDRRYPVLYLFRGHEREWVHRQQDKSRRNRTVIDVYRDLLDEGKVGPVILVFPGISSDDNRVPGLLVNFRQPELAARETGIGLGRFEDYFVRELVPYVDSHFRTIGNKGGRAVDGFSLGGFESIKIASQHPDMFCSAGAFDGTFLYAINNGRRVRARDRVLNNPMFDAAWGVPRNLDFVAENSPTNLIAMGDREPLARIQWLIRSGPQEAEPWQSNYYRCQHLLSFLKARDIPNGLPDVFAGATHNWHWADRHMLDTLPLHWAAMARAFWEANARQLATRIYR